MRVITICCIFLQTNAITVEDASEKLIKVWEDRIQHTDLDADEVNFPLLMKDDVNDIDADEVKLPMIIEDKIDEATSDHETPADESQFLEKHEPNKNSSIITFFHKITANNITRQGVTTMHSASLLPLIKTALGSMSGESMLILGLGGLLPLLMMSIPFVVMAFVIPVVFIIVSTMLGVAASSLVFLPLFIFGSGLFSLTDFHFLDKMSSFDGVPSSNYASSFENFPSVFENFSSAFEKFPSKFENYPDYSAIEQIDDIINMDMEKFTTIGENPSFEVNNNNVPRLLY